ncbi:MAG: class I tRNA ligase family protein, partial [Deltaproteobacteria bacterium]|nr:class I tRNA ligase family protein [Deltaproteobacteria bacterium]
EEELKEKADLYLEGSDQHRGWFHSSLLASVATRKSAPYDAVLTHGFVVDGKGKKMSKSTGNVISPDDVIKKYGAEVLRLWVASEDYRDDIRISDEILKRLSEAYRRIRNTLRYILGNLSDFDPAKDMVAYSELTELDRLTLSKLSALNERVRTAYDEFEFHVIYHSVHNFCSVDLSSFYLDILKDRLYTAKKDSNSRRAAQTTIYHILDHLVRLLSPVLVFTTEEAWDFMPDRDAESVHLSGFLEPDKEWQDKELDEKWAKIHDLKTDISRAIELSRKDKVIGHSLDARVSIEVPSELSAFVEEVVSTLKEILIVSSVEITSGLDDKYAESSVMEGLKVKVTKAEGEKCERCWKIEPSVGENKEHTTICGSCVEAIS